MRGRSAQSLIQLARQRFLLSCGHDRHDVGQSLQAMPGLAGLGWKERRKWHWMKIGESLSSEFHAPNQDREAV